MNESHCFDLAHVFRADPVTGQLTRYCIKRGNLIVKFAYCSPTSRPQPPGGLQRY